jgi:hypothetical protein
VAGHITGFYLGNSHEKPEQLQSVSLLNPLLTRRRFGNRKPGHSMHEHQFSFDINGRKEHIWAVLWGKQTGDVTAMADLRVEILHGGDQNGNGLIRHKQYTVPRYLLSRGKAQSWEWITEVKVNESWRYDAVCKPLWSKASGYARLEALPDHRTRIHCSETYHVFNPILRFLLEKKLHIAIAKDSRRKLRIAIEQGLRTGAYKEKVTGKERKKEQQSGPASAE